MSRKVHASFKVTDMSAKRNADSEIAQEIWRFILSFNDRWGRPPTYAEIEEGCIRGPQTVKDYMKVLEEAGYLKRPSNAYGKNFAGQRRMQILKDQV